jgi:plastocyanin
VNARRIAAVAAPLAVLLAAPATAAGTAPAPASAHPSAARAVTVKVENMAFTPSSVTVQLDETVIWSFLDAVTHNSTSLQGFWVSGPHTEGGTYARDFTSAGSFGYLCTLHPEMRGTVKVRMKAVQSRTSGWAVRWATEAGTDVIDYDVQLKKPGSTKWTAYRTDTRNKGAAFNPAQDGTYSFRARTARNGKASGWSPVKRVQIG